MLNNDIVNIRAGSNRDICRNGPGRCRPYDRAAGAVVGICPKYAVGVCAQAKTHVDRRVGTVSILNLRIRQSGFVDQRPVNRPQAAIDKAGCYHFREHVEFFGRHLLRHGQVGMIPIASDSETLELQRLLADPLFSHFSAAVPNFHACRGQILGAKFFGHQDFNRQTVVIPPRHIGSGITFHTAVFGGYVFENFIESMSDMDVAIRERRSVMQNKRSPAGLRLERLFIDFMGFPKFQGLRLTLGEVRTLGNGIRIRIQAVRVFNIGLRHI